MNPLRTGYRTGMDVRSVAIPLAAALLAGGLVGCGSDEVTTISAASSDALHREVEAVRAAVKDGRNPAALAAVADLRAAINRLAADGELNPADGLVLLTQVNRIAQGIEARATSAPIPDPTPVVGVERPRNGDDDDDDDDDDKGNGKGKGKDKDKDNGDD